MKIAFVCYLSNPTYWIAKYVVELENNLNFYICNELDQYDRLTYIFFMGILYVDTTFFRTTIPRKTKHNKLKKYYEFDVKFIPNEFNKEDVLYMYKRIIDELLIILQSLKVEDNLHENLIQCVKDFQLSMDKR